MMRQMERQKETERYLCVTNLYLQHDVFICVHTNPLFMKDGHASNSCHVLRREEHMYLKTAGTCVFGKNPVSNPFITVTEYYAVRELARGHWLKWLRGTGNLFFSISEI